MSLRTPNPLTNYQTRLDLQRSKERMTDLSNQISSGNRLLRLSDDPTGSALVLDFQNSIAINKQHIDQANRATSFLKTSETTLSSLDDSLQRLLELGQQGQSDITGSNGRANIANEVDGIRSTILSLANTQSQGKFLYSGTMTTTEPFTLTATGANYAGNGASINLDITSSTSVSTNIPGNTVFFGAGGQGSSTDMFTQVTNLRDALTSNNSAGIKTACDNIKNIQSALNNQITDLGGRQASIEQITTDLGSYNESLQTIQNTYQSVDYPTAISEWYQEQTAQQASLSVISKTGKTNLFDYLG